MTWLRKTDGFYLFTGVLSVVSAPAMLASGAPAGWSCLLFAAGLVILSTQVLTAYDVEFEIAGWAHVAALVVALLCLGVAVVYLTRAADDLPTVFPGHDADSEQFKLVPGAIALGIGVVLLGRTLALAHTTRTPRRHP
jgi:hypothetical protein